MRTLFTQCVTNEFFLFFTSFGLLTHNLHPFHFPYFLNFSRNYYIIKVNYNLSSSFSKIPFIILISNIHLLYNSMALIWDNNRVFSIVFFPLHNSTTIIVHWVKSIRIRSFSGSYFPAFGLNTERYGVSLCIQTKWGKIRTRKTPNADTFHAVIP